MVRLLGFGFEEKITEVKYHFHYIWSAISPEEDWFQHPLQIPKLVGTQALEMAPHVYRSASLDSASLGLCSTGVFIENKSTWEWTQALQTCVVPGSKAHAILLTC